MYIYVCVNELAKSCVVWRETEEELRIKTIIDWFMAGWHQSASSNGRAENTQWKMDIVRISEN